MSTRKITPRDQPVFPCWLWYPKQANPLSVPGWIDVKCEQIDQYLATHWHPDQPSAPEPVKEDWPLPARKENADGTTTRSFAHPTAPDWAEHAAKEILHAMEGLSPVTPERMAKLIARHAIRDHHAAQGGEDARRLDWLDKNCTHVADSERYLQRHVYWGGGTHKDVRAAIDAAMQQEASK